LGLEEALAELERQATTCPEVRPIVDFISRSKRGIIR
jgi:acyl-[acyl carrier protein]--UDP-N-acetylglucosamine O-acyltransferase